MYIILSTIVIAPCIIQIFADILSENKIKNTFHYIKNAGKTRTQNRDLVQTMNSVLYQPQLTQKLTDTQRYSKAVQISLEVRIKLYYKNIRQGK